ncbi:MAG: hypothetical protein U0793_02790 [Gemmataceae bacterium]
MSSPQPRQPAARCPRHREGGNGDDLLRPRRLADRHKGARDTKNIVTGLVGLIKNLAPTSRPAGHAAVPLLLAWARPGYVDSLAYAEPAGLQGAKPTTDEDAAATPWTSKILRRDQGCPRRKSPAW